MRHIYIIFLSIVYAHAALDAYSIVFVHLGPKLPPYLVDATLQARLFNKCADIMVIAEQTALDQTDRTPFVACGVKFVTCEQLVTTSMHKKFNQETTINKNSRKGFWWKTIERFFYVDELINQYQL